MHHKIYYPNRLPWEYAYSDCVTLCKGCHAREHNKIEPDSGWTLIEINDLGDLSGTCERQGCGAELRYEHLIYHPNWGYKSVGSSCIEHLTREERNLSDIVLKIYSNISNFINSSKWEDGFTQKGKKFIFTKYKHSIIRIYGVENDYAFQIGVKQKGIKKFEFGEIIKSINKNLIQTKELAFIVLKGTLTNLENEKEVLRNIYKKTR